MSIKTGAVSREKIDSKKTENGKNNRDFSFDKKIEVNSWLIKSRWFYVGGILLIGFLTKIISESNVSFSYFLMTLIAVGFVGINLFFYLFLQNIKKTKSSLGLTILGSLGISVELAIFICVMHLAGGIDSVSIVFFFMPIVSSSLIFGAKGSIITALVSALLINSLVVFEYFGVVPHVLRYGVDTLEFKSLSITLTKTITISIFYFIIGWLSGYGAKLLFKREYLLQKKSEKLNEEVSLRQKELIELDKTTKLLAGKDSERMELNSKLQDRVNELEETHRLMIGREEKMIELKEKLKEVEERLPKGDDVKGTRQK